MSRRPSQASSGSGGSRGSTGSVGRARGPAARGINASSTPKSDTKSPGQDVQSPAASPINRPGQSSPVPDTVVRQPPRTKSVQFNPGTSDSSRQSRQSQQWCSNKSRSKNKDANISAVLLESLIENADETSDDLSQDKASSMMWRPHDVSRLVAQEAEEVRLAVLLSRSTAAAEAAKAAAEAEQSRSSGSELWHTPSSGSSASKSRSSKTRPSQQHALGESLRHVQRELRPMPVSDTAPQLFDDENIAETLSAEDAAAMMHRLEHGYSMAAPPRQLFQFLFPGEGSLLSTSPEDDADAGADKADPGQQQEGGKPKGEGDEHGECPIICFGSERGTNPAPYTLVQVRGDVPPSWFPGYLMALPETFGKLEAKPSPTEVMHAAYRAAQPSKVPHRSRIVY